jgi:hypothetical protein
LRTWLRGARYLVEHAIESFRIDIGSDLAGHVDEALELLWIVGRRFGLAGHGLSLGKFLADPRENMDRGIQSFDDKRGVPVVCKRIYGYNP